MSIKSLNPYITFNGTAAQAIALYERILGAQRVNIARAGDIPGMSVPTDQKDRVVHGVLILGGTKLMVSDATSDLPTGATFRCRWISPTSTT